MRITVTREGPCVVTGGVPLAEEEIVYDGAGDCRDWRVVRRYTARQRYALCRCGRSGNPPFCDGSHAKTGFDGTESAGDEPYLRRPQVFRGPGLELTDYEPLCARARFCLRAGGIRKLTMESGSPGAWETAVEESCNCPSGRLVLTDRRTGEVIEPDLGRSIAVVENPARGEHGPLWVRGGIPVLSADGRPYTVRNRITLCRCGKSRNKPFCDGSHVPG